MIIWILAILTMAAVSLAAWRQGAIRAAFAFVGIIFAALLAVPLGHLIHPLLPHLGVTSPITAWWVAPIVGFIVASIPLKVAGHMVHVRIEHFYKYRAGDLRQALWSRLNTRLGICIGLMNGAAYFVLISFFLFNASYWTTQAATHSPDFSDQPMTLRMVDNMGEGLQSSGFSRTASAVGTLPPLYYQLADFMGLLMQNPQLGGRLGEYPGFISLWHREEMQSLVTDANLTNALSSGAPLGEVLNYESVKALIANKELTKVLLDALTSNLNDLTNYLASGQSTKYNAEAILGTWSFNSPVTIAWMRQDQPKMGASELAAIRGLWTQAYGQATFLMTADKQLFVKGWPKFVAQPQPNQPPFQPLDGKGDWSRDGNNYTLHFTYGSDEKFLSGTTEANGLRLRIKDGRTILIFDRAD